MWDENIGNVNVSSAEASTFGFPNCKEGDKLIVLKTYQGINADYIVWFKGSKQLGLKEQCTGTKNNVGQNLYCFDRGFNQDGYYETTVAVICGQPKTCIRHCCPDDKYLSEDGNCYSMKPNDPEKPWKIEFTDDTKAKYQNFTNFPCAGVRASEGNEKWSFESNGDVTLNLIKYPYHQYCLTYTDIGNGTYIQDVLSCEQDSCYGPVLSWECTVDLTLIPILMGFSIFFLFLLQYVIWSEKKDKLYECMQLCNLLMLTLVFLILIILKQTTNRDLPSALCEILGILYHFSYMSALFWLSAMSKSIYKTFQGIQVQGHQEQKQKYGFYHPKFKFYALYAFGCPAIVSLVTIILQYLPKEYQDSYIAPRINDQTGQSSCLLGPSRPGLDKPELWYFHLINIMVMVRIEQKIILEIM